MRVVLQRVRHAEVRVDGEIVGSVGKGYLLLVGIGREDDERLLEPMARRIVNMRLFADPDGDSHFHRSLLEEKGGILAVSQFTLFADARKGRRPSFSHAADPGPARMLFDHFVEVLRAQGVTVETGVFGALMEVSLLNDGPVTLWLDSDEILGRRE